MDATTRSGGSGPKLSSRADVRRSLWVVSTGGFKVLIVDDDADIRDLLRINLTDRADSVDEATNGQDAIDIAAESQPDVIVLDQQMPHMDGTTALPRLRAVSPHSRILMYSAVLEGHEASAAGADAYASKWSATADVVTLVELLADT